MEHGGGCMVVRNIGDVDRYLGRVRDAAGKIHAWIAAQTGDPLDLLRQAAMYWLPARMPPSNSTS